MITKPLRYLSLLFILFTLSNCNSEQETSTTPPNDISIGWELLKNFEYNGAGSHEAIFTITNNSDYELKDNWEIYWNQSPRLVKFQDSSILLQISHINGDYFKMTPKKGFRLAANSKIDFRYIGAAMLIKYTDAPLGIYSVFNPDSNPVIRLVKEINIAPITEDIQINRNKFDKQAIPTPAYIFKENESLSLIPADRLHKAIPTPTNYIPFGGNFELHKITSIQAPDSLLQEAALLAGELENLTGIKPAIKKEGGNIVLKISNNPNKKEGSYVINVNSGAIQLTGNDKAGVFYGIQTLLQMSDENGNIPGGTIDDEPAFDYRGLHIDVSRNFQSKETIMRIVDLLGRYKVNKLILCLTDDEGWRLEIKGLPELTAVGSKRGHPSKDGGNLEPAYGSGPFISSTTGTGFYTRKEFVELLKYANERHVDIIPLINLPGHARAAIKAMEYRYNNFMKAGKEKEAKEFRLIDPEDQSKYLSAQFYKDNIVCVCRPEVYHFYEYVVDDILSMYQEAAVEIDMFHTGGDEVPRGAWTASPICNTLMKENPDIKNHRNLQIYFFDKVTRMLQDKKVKIAGWEEVVMSFKPEGGWETNTSFVDRQVYPNIWNNLWGQQDLGYRIANRGYPIVLCNVTNFYFDLAYSKDPREPGLYWGGFNNTKDAFEFIPDNLFYSTTTDNNGKKLNPAVDFKNMERLNEVGKNNIYGLQAQLWSETVKGRDMIETYILPKLFGFAERAWSGTPSWANDKNPVNRQGKLDADWNRFANTLSQKDFKKLDQLGGGYHYHLPTPGILELDGKLYMNSAYPGMEIRYTLDGSDPTSSSEVYEGPVDFEGGTVTAKVFNTAGRSGLSSTYSTDKTKKPFQ